MKPRTEKKVRNDREDRILGAMEAVRGGAVSMRQAAFEYDVSPSTVSRRLRGSKNHREGAERLQKLPPEQEALLVEWIEREGRAGRVLTTRDVIGFVEGLLKIRMGRKGKGKGEGEREEKKKRLVGVHWVNRFMRRHPEMGRCGLGEVRGRKGGRGGTRGTRKKV
ncbi:hypothetical protein F4774DRAFT_264274 [Daldinia eschscholtzii]|nr:hypothetical protein F4774DRAFT_264274 [Daldinia eschscholtzii]